MTKDQKEDLIFLLKMYAVITPLYMLGMAFLWLLCWGRYVWPSLTWLP